MRVTAWLSVFTFGSLIASCASYTNLGEGPEAGAGGDDDGSGGSSMQSGGSAGTGGRSMGTGGSEPGTGGKSMGTGGGSAGTGPMPGAGTGGGGTLPNACTGLPCGSRCALDLGLYPEMIPMNPEMGDTPAAGGDSGAGDVAVVLGYCADDGSCGPAFPVCSGTQCEADQDCPALPGLCALCPDGLISCATTSCVNGICAIDAPGCKNECETSAECPVSSAPCQMCPDGSSSCPRMECLMGQCVGSVPGCGDYEPCDGLDCGDPCGVCEPGSMNCASAPTVLSYCNAEGSCQTGMPMCEPGDECKVANDCPQLELCYMCKGGSCGVTDCVNGNCGFTCPDDPEPECSTTADCGEAPPICEACADGSCAAMACLGGECVLACDSVQICMSDDQCPSCGQCGDLTVCVPYECREGLCHLPCENYGHLD